MTLPLFDPQPKSVPEVGTQPVICPENRDGRVSELSQTAELPNCAIRQVRRPDVIRVIEHKRGPFRWLSSDASPRDHVVVQLTDGRFLVELIDDGSRFPLNWNHDDVERNVKNGMWREVPIER